MSYTSPKYDKETISTIPIELTKYHEKHYMPMLSKETFQDQSISSCSTSSCSLQNYVQASNAPIKGISPIIDTHEYIYDLGYVSHSKDANIHTHYPPVSSESILGPYPSKLKLWMQ